MPDTTVRIVQVTQKETRSGPVYQIETDGDTYQTWKKPIAEEARGFEGQRADISYEVKQNNPNFPPNLYLNAVRAASNGQSSFPVSADSTGGTTVEVEPSNYMRRRDPEEALQIMRQSAAQRANELARDMLENKQELWTLEERLVVAERYVQFFQTGLFSQSGSFTGGQGNDLGGL